MFEGQLLGNSLESGSVSGTFGSTWVRLVVTPMREKKRAGPFRVRSGPLGCHSYWKLIRNHFTVAVWAQVAFISAINTENQISTEFLACQSLTG